MTIAEQIYAIVKALPQDQASEILTFAEFIRAKHLNANQPISTVESPIPWTELVNALAGTWDEDFPTLEDIRASSGEDILRESLWMYVLDTNTLIYYFKGQGQVAQYLKSVSPQEIGVSTSRTGID